MPVDNTEQLFIGAAVPASECPRTLQEMVDTVAKYIVPNPNFEDNSLGEKEGILIGGSAPTSDQGPWLPTGETDLWYWDETLSAYFPGGIPSGTIMPIATVGNAPGNNWLACTGSAVSQLQYPRLYLKVGQSFAIPDNQRTNSSTGADAAALNSIAQFRLPDMRGCVILGAGAGRVWINDATQFIPQIFLGDRLGDYRNLLTNNQMNPVIGYGSVFEYDALITNAGQPRIYGGAYYRPNQEDTPGRDEVPPQTEDGKYLHYFQPSNACPYYIRV